MKLPYVLLVPLLFTLFSTSARAQAGNENPTGVAGQFNGNVTTAGSYDPTTGNVMRSITDLVVAGTVGDYGLTYTRTWNSRQAGNWSDSFAWSIGSLYGVSPQTSAQLPLTVLFPDGRIVTFVGSLYGSTPLKGGKGIQERLQTAGSSVCYLLLPDGGKVEFSVTKTLHHDAELIPADWADYEFAVQALTDPHGLRTSFTWTGGRISQVTEPAGRWIKVFYTPAGQVDYIQGSDGRIVDYTYVSTTFSPGIVPFTVLTQVDYFGDPTLRALYTYEKPNVGGVNGAPLLKTCIDPMYAGPMKEISYTYATANNPDGSTPVHGQILSENHRATGLAISTLTMNTSNTATETRGDKPVSGGQLPARTFAYGSGFLLNWTDFKGKSSSKTYDANGYLKSKTDENGKTTDFVSDAITGNVTKITHPLTTFDGGTRPTREVVYGGPGCPDSNNADASGIYYVHKVKDERGSWTTYWRDANKRVRQVDYPAGGGSESFIYNSFGQGLQHTMTNGAVETFTFDARGLLQTHITPATSSVSVPAPTVFAYYPAIDYRVDRVHTVTDPLGHSTNYDYNSRGQITRVTHPDTSYAQAGYNADGTLAWEADETHPLDTTKWTRYVYDDYKRPLSVTNPAGEVAEFSYAPWGATGDYSHTNAEPYTVVSSAAKSLHYGYDSNLRRVWTRQAPGVSGQDAYAYVDYDFAGNATSVTDFNNHVTAFTYDERNRRTSQTDPAPFNSQISYWEYDGMGHVTKEIRPDTKFRRLEYDAMQRLWKAHDEMDRVTTYEYFVSGAVKSVTDPKQQKTEFTYDARNLLESRTYPAPNGGAALTGWKYDAANNLIERPTVGGPKQLFAYDNRNRLETMRWSSAIDFSDFEYDTANRLTQARNPYSTVVRNYDAAGRLILDQQTPAATVNAPATTVSPVSVVSRKTHGASGTFDISLPLTGTSGVESRSGGTNGDYSLILTFANPVTAASALVSSGTGTVAGFSVSTNVLTLNLTGVSNAQRMTVALAGVTQGSNTGQVIVPIRVVVGDANGDGTVNGSDVTLVSANSGVPLDATNFRADVNVNGSINNSDRLMVQAASGATAAALIPPQVQVSCAYENGELRRLFVPGSSYDWAFSYDAAGRLEKFLEGVGGPARHQYGYDLAGNVTGRTNLENGTAQTSLFDEMNRIKERKIQAAAYDATQHLYQFAREVYGYDVNSRLSSTTRDEDGRRDFLTYNDAGELLQADYGQQWNGTAWVNPLRFQSYTPDLAGNRQATNDNGLQTVWSSNSMNQYLSAGGNTVTHGSQHEITGYDNVTYRYLADGQLAQASSSAAGTYELGYDALGRTVRRTTNGQVTFYIYSGASAILEYAGSGELTASNVNGPQADELITRDKSGVRQFFFQDRLGSTRAVSNAGGEVIEQYRYDAFGAPVFFSGPTTGWPVTNQNGTATSGNTTMVNNCVLFTGREWVPQHKFYEYRARTYHPKLGRFMSEDPLGLDAGEPNLFRYCGNDPVNRSDPSGLIWISTYNYRSFNRFGHIGIGVAPGYTSGFYPSPGGYMTAPGGIGPSAGNFSGTVHADNAKDLENSFYIATTPEQDKAIMDALNAWNGQTYNYVSQNCAHAVIAALRAAGLNVNGSRFPRDVLKNLIKQYGNHPGAGGESGSSGQASSGSTGIIVTVVFTGTTVGYGTAQFYELMSQPYAFYVIGPSGQRVPAKRLF